MSGTITVAHSHQRTVWSLVAVVVLMFGFGFAMVPLYNWICQAVGLQAAVPAGPIAAGKDSTVVRPVTVKFDTSVNGDLPWHFRALTRRLETNTSEIKVARFEVQNLSDRPLVGQAIPSVTPWQAGPYFNKLDCFCFENQRLNPGETKEVTLRFAVSGDLPERFHSLTISYTFMRSQSETDQSTARSTKS